jgi:plasmid replication initiation protein
MSLDESDWERMYGKTPTVYGETKMIKISKTYHLALTEEQSKELYQLLKTEKDSGCLTPDKELKLVYHELKNLFDTGSHLR